MAIRLIYATFSLSPLFTAYFIYALLYALLLRHADLMPLSPFSLPRADYAAYLLMTPLMLLMFFAAYRRHAAAMIIAAAIISSFMLLLFRFSLLLRHAYAFIYYAYLFYFMPMPLLMIIADADATRFAAYAIDISPRFRRHADMPLCCR